MLVETIIGALLPVAVESGKQLITKWVGGVRPTTIDEQIKLDQSEVARMEALAKLDTPVGTPSQWVIDLRASARYVGALVVIGVGISALYVPVEESIRTLALEAANIAFGFLFGSRIVSGWNRK
jgi:hypothetical protein